MIPAGVHGDVSDTAPAPMIRSPAFPGVRLLWLHLVSRRAATALPLLAGLGLLLWVALHWRWNMAGGPAARDVLPLVVQAGAAATVAVATYNPFGEQERAMGHRLPWLRLGGALLLMAAAIGALTAGATGGLLPGGSLALLRNTAGMTGTGLLSAAVLGGAFAWTGPMAYWLVTEGALAGGWTTPWIWPARPPHDLGGALCAAVVFAAGSSAIALWGSRDRAAA